MLLVSVFVVCTIALCGANRFTCHHYTETTKSLRIYCDRTDLPKNCSKDALSMSPTDVLNLKIEGCDQSRIADASAQYPNIELLDISYSSYSSLDWTGEDFKRVVVLNASCNDLSAVPTQILSKFPKIKKLHLANNKLDRISNGDFANVGQGLTDIILTNNMLTSIDSNAFENLTQLHGIELSHNQFSAFPVALSKSTVQDIILLENSKLTRIDCTFIRSLGAKHVYFTWENIIAFDGSCSQWKFAIDKNGWNTMDGIYPNFALRSKIFCSRDFVSCFGNIQSFVAGPFYNVKQMLDLISASAFKIDLSCNQIEAHEEIETINETSVDNRTKLLDPLSNPQNISIRPNTSQTVDFERFPNLHELNLSNTGLHRFTFSSIKSNKLKRLDVSKNNITVLDSISRMRRFTQLTHFDAAENGIEYFEIDHLPSSIQYVNLSGNPLKRTLKNYERFKALAHLNLSDTQLSISDEDSFYKLRHLITLDISNNNLSHVNFSALSSLYRLKEFRAANAQLTNINEIVRHLSTSVEKLDLAGNPVANIDLASFERLKNLKELNLSGINTGDEIDIGQLPSTLETLALRGNQLEEIVNLDRKHFPVLKTLDIMNNQLDCDDLKDHLSEFKDGAKVFSDKCHKLWIILFTILTILGILLFIILCNLCIMPKITKD